jgi:serine protease inhibitor
MPMSKLLAAVGIAAALATSAPAAGQPAEVGAGAFEARLAAAQARLAVNAIQRLSSRGKRVVAVSPASLAGAGAALDLGASPDLRRALHAVLGFSDSAADAADFVALREKVARLGAAGERTPLRMANSVVFDDGVTLYPGVALAFRHAGLDHEVVDFGAAGAADKINKWVSERTGGLIPEIIDRLPGATSVVVLNALHFKDRWKTPFDAAETRPAPFRRVGARPVTVPAMHLPQGRYLFRRDARFVGIELPYSDERFRMVVVTTRGESPAPARTFRPIGEWLAGKGFAEAEGELALPRFDISSREDLTATMDSLGLKAARLAPGALSGFTPDPARISRILQRLELRLNEEGTEAAAATAVMVERGGTADYVRMVVDKPFVFALRDSATGLILAAGYVGQPGTLATAAR